MLTNTSAKLIYGCPVTCRRLKLDMAAVMSSRALSSLSRLPTLSVRRLATVVEPDSAPQARLEDGTIRQDWRRSEIQRIFDAPLMETVYRAVRPFTCVVSCLLSVDVVQAKVHRMHHDPSRIQLCTLMNIKSACILLFLHLGLCLTIRTAGGCSEDCKYCSQSSSYKTPTKASRLVDVEPVLEAARRAKENGSTRFCMGAAWRDLAGKKSGFEKILRMVTEVRGMGMEGELFGGEKDCCNAERYSW